MVKLGPAAIDIVTNIERVQAKALAEECLCADHWIARNLIAQSRLWAVEGFLYRPTVQAVEELESVANSGGFVILDASDIYVPALVCFGRPREFRWRLEEGAGPLNRPFSFRFAEVPAWGRTYANKGNSRIADLLYLTIEKDVVPLWGRCGFTLDRTNKTLSYELYLLNTAEAAAMFFYFEVQHMDEWTQFRVYSWDSSDYFADPFLYVPTLNAPGIFDSDKLRFLDGETATTKYGAGKGAAVYFAGERGRKSARKVGDSDSDYEVTCGMKPGCKHRTVFAVKLPAKTGSDDLTGVGAANKVHVKVEIRWEEEDTRFIDGSIDFAPPQRISSAWTYINTHGRMWGCGVGGYFNRE